MEILTANEPTSKWEPNLLSRDRGDLLQTDSQCLFSICTGETHKTSTSTMARLAYFIKLTVQKHINKNRSPSREKTSLVKTLKARARGKKYGGTLPKPCQDGTIKDCFLLKQSMLARFVRTPLWKWIGLVHASKIIHFCLQWRVSVCGYNSGQNPLETSHKARQITRSLSTTGSLINLCGNQRSLKSNENPRYVYSHCILTCLLLWKWYKS